MSADHSRAAFLRFLDYLGEKGLIPTATAAARKATANKVMAILDEHEAQDVTGLDLEAVMRRFENLNPQQYTPESLRSYTSRMRTALGDFRSYCENPLGFKPVRSSRARKNQNGQEPGASPLKPRNEAAEAKQRAISNFPNVAILPIAIRSNVTIQIAGLPFDLTKAEAQKVANIILAHATVDG